MRKVKFLLNYKDSRETEFRLAKLRSATEETDRRNNREKDSPEKIEALKEMANEQHPDGGLRLSDVTEWSSGDPWKAHRFEVIDDPSKGAKIKETLIPHPSIPAEKTTGESMDPVASVVALAVDPGPAITQTPAIDPGALDSPPTPTSSSGDTWVLDEEMNQLTNQPNDGRLVRCNAVIFGSPPRKRSFEEESETALANVNGKGKAVARESLL
ncbi:hypothetical protein JB92DRAFT_2851168 [Gautieria morchelliformis]|nr:hypothetical protein JB92DRAFT_2851168 [Gautieria morchelliformis]